MRGQPTPWRASKVNGPYRVLRTTFLGYATRVEVIDDGRVWPTFAEADARAASANAEGTAF